MKTWPLRITSMLLAVYQLNYSETKSYLSHMRHGQLFKDSWNLCPHSSILIQH